MMSYASHLVACNTPQSEPLPGSSQVANSAGGFSFAVDDWARLDRFLVLGSEGGSYYASERKLTQENAAAVVRCIQDDGAETVRRIVAVSTSGRAPKNDPAIFALALAAALGSPATKAAAYAAVNAVCRTGTHLFAFVEASQALRGWGKGLRRAVCNWYSSKSARDMAYQVSKYQQRNGWSHRDLFRLAHPRLEPGSDHQLIAHWVVKGWPGVGEQPHDRAALLPIWALERARRASSEQEIVRLIRDYHLVREAIPTQWLGSPAVWEALLEEMPLTALVRNLAKMTVVGLLGPLSAATSKVCEALGNQEALRKARLHPLNLLVALRTYARGHGERGSLRWSPLSQVVDALDQAFYVSFTAVEPTGKRWLLGVDVSGSMDTSIAGLPLSCRDAAAALALVTASTEKQHHIMKFDQRLMPLNISPRQRLDDAIREASKWGGGGTDCSLPVLYALDNRIAVDAFVVLTDSETWAGHMHPCQALQRYRDRMGIPARLIVVGMVSNGFTIADPNDAGMLDVVGFDTDVPAVMADFVRSGPALS